VTVELDGTEYAVPLSQVCEVLRMGMLTGLPGLPDPVAGVLDLRGTALPVVDARRDRGRETAGDVLVLIAADGALTGLAVDAVRAVVGEFELGAPGEGEGAGAGADRDGVGPDGGPAAGPGGVVDPGRRGLPAYVTDVRRHDGRLVYVVDALALAACA